MGGSITYHDGRKRKKWYIGYEIVHLKVEFEPQAKQGKPAWSVW